MKASDSKKIKRFPRELPKLSKEQDYTLHMIEEKCMDFMCPGRVIDVKSGPMITEYKFQPDKFTRLKRLKTLNEDLAIAIPAEQVSVVRVPGESCVGISVPNKERRIVKFDECLKNVLTHRHDMELPINFGITSSGRPFVEDLATMPHLLIAGETGAGKSVFLNNIITSLLYIRSPKQMELILIDPKSVELLPYKGLPHVKREPVSDIFSALALLETVVQEMRRRMSFLHFRKVKNLKELNDKLTAEGNAEERLPYWVLVIDEMADLMLGAKKEFTKRMAEIASMARAAGIHVITATQRPSVDVLSGKIKVNFPARVAFRVPSDGDSRTILSRKGAEQLLSKGDMWYLSPSKSGMQRLHAPFIQQDDINRMLTLSLQLGHVHNVPADGLPTPPPAPPQQTAAPKKNGGRKSTPPLEEDGDDKEGDGQPFRVQ